MHDAVHRMQKLYLSLCIRSAYTRHGYTCVGCPNRMMYAEIDISGGWEVERGLWESSPRRTKEKNNLLKVAQPPPPPPYAEIDR